MKRTMKLEDIIISDSFANTIPREEKMNICREYWNNNHSQDRYIVVTKHNVLIDGYIQYLILKEMGETECEIRIGKHKENRWKSISKDDSWDTPKYRTEPTTYIYGYHPNSRSQKIRMWRVPSKWTWVTENIEVGDMVQCRVKNGVSPVVVTEVKTLSECPVDFPVRKLASMSIRRNGNFVE